MSKNSQDNLKKQFYGVLKSNFVASISDNNLSYMTCSDENFLKQFIYFLTFNLEKALDKTFLDLSDVLANESKKHGVF